MKTRNRIIGLILGAALFAPAAAFARDHGHRGDHERRERHERYESRHDRYDRHWEYRDYRRVPPPPPNARGSYQWQTVSTWVDGGWDQQYVPAGCEIRPFTGRQRCWEAHYDRRWVPGHYENIQQWVWVGYSHGWRS